MLKIGDRVNSLKYGNGTIICVDTNKVENLPYLVEFDYANKEDLHSGGGRGESDKCLWCTDGNASSYEYIITPIKEKAHETKAPKKEERIEKEILSTLGIKKYIINENACVIYGTSGSKIVVRRTEKDEFDKEKAFLNALLQYNLRYSIYSKKSINTFLANLKVCKKK